MQKPVEVKNERPYDAITISTRENTSVKKEVIVRMNENGIFYMPTGCIGIMLEAIKLSKIDTSVLRLLQNAFVDSIEDSSGKQKGEIQMFLNRSQVIYMTEIVAKRMEHCESERSREVKYVWQEENEMKFRYKFDPATYIEMKLLYFELKDWLSLSLA